MSRRSRRTARPSVNPVGIVATIHLSTRRVIAEIVKSRAPEDDPRIQELDIDESPDEPV